MKSNFYLILFFSIISVIGSELFTFILSFSVLSKTKDSSYFSYILIVSTLTYVIVGPYLGYLIDLYNKKHIAIVLQISSMIILFLYISFESLMDVKSMVLFLIFILTVSDVGVSLVFNSDLTTLINEIKIDKFLSYRSIINSSLGLGIPVVAGIIYSQIELVTFLKLVLLCELISLLVLYFIKFQNTTLNRNIDQKVNEKRKLFLSEYNVIISYVYKNKDILSIVVIAMTLNFFMTFITVGIPTIAIVNFNLNSNQFGIIQSLTALGMLLGGIMFTKINTIFNTFISVRNSLFMIFLSFIILTSAYILQFDNIKSLLVFCFFNFIMGVSMQTANLSLSSYLQRFISDHIKGKYFAFHSAVVQFTMPIGYLVAGILFKYTHLYLFIFIFLSTMMLIFSLYFNFIKSIDKSIGIE